MAPRRRRQKRGNTRTDAALDAMRQYGFSSSLVRQALKQLLNEYGGDDGWFFIEDSSYVLLIETLLQNQKDPSDNDTLAIKDTETAEPSCRAIELTCAEATDVNTELIAAADAVNFASAGNEALEFEPQIDDTGAQDEDGLRESEKLESVKDPETTKDLTSTLFTRSPKPEAFLSPRKRRPYHGWICDDEDHDPNDLVDLIPEPLSVLWKKLLRAPKKRIQRWDVRPQDV